MQQKADTVHSRPGSARTPRKGMGRGPVSFPSPTSKRMWGVVTVLKNGDSVVYDTVARNSQGLAGGGVGAGRIECSIHGVPPRYFLALPVNLQLPQN